MEYYVHRTCYDCSHTEKVVVTKQELAFSYYLDKKLKKHPCPHCGSQTGGSLSYQTVELDQELLDLWGHDSRLSLLEQDEDLMLANVQYLPMILEALDTRKYTKYKLHTLVSALCVLVYDNRTPAVKPKDEVRRREIFNTAVEALRARRALVQEATPSIMEYIRKVVFPLIGK